MSQKHDYLCEWLLCGDWSVNIEACLWQSYLPCTVLLGVRLAGIKARGEMETCDRNKGIPSPGLEMDTDQYSHSMQPSPSPFFRLTLPPLAPAGQPCSPCYFVVLFWLFKSFLKNTGLTQQQHRRV